MTPLDSDFKPFLQVWSESRRCGHRRKCTEVQQDYNTRTVAPASSLFRPADVTFLIPECWTNADYLWLNVFVRRAPNI